MYKMYGYNRDLNFAFITTNTTTTHSATTITTTTTLFLFFRQKATHHGTNQFEDLSPICSAGLLPDKTSQYTSLKH